MKKLMGDSRFKALIVGIVGLIFAYMGWEYVLPFATPPTSQPTTQIEQPIAE